MRFRLSKDQVISLVFLTAFFYYIATMFDFIVTMRAYINLSELFFIYENNVFAKAFLIINIPPFYVMFFPCITMFCYHFVNKWRDQELTKKRIWIISSLLTWNICGIIIHVLCGLTWFVRGVV